MAENKIKVLEVFSGAGGLSLGFDLVRNGDGERVYEIVLAVDNDKYACQTMRKYFKKEYGREDIVLEADLTLPDTHKKIIEKCREGVDITIGGPPCQSFSLIGPRSGNGKKNKKKYKIMDLLYKKYLNLVRELKPSFIVFENVKGILSKKKGKDRYIDIIISDFKALGYSFESENEKIKTDYIVLNAADYGVPQMRERVFLIGNRFGIKNPYPVKTHNEDKYITLFEAIGNLPRLKARLTNTGIKSEVWKKRIKERNKKVFSGNDSTDYPHDLFKSHREKLDENGKAFLDFIKPNGIIHLKHHVARSQKRDDVLLFRGMKQGMTAGDIVKSQEKNIRRLGRLIKYDMSSFMDKYKKQSWNKPSSTIFAHLEKDGNRFIHPDSSQARTITPREAARIQSFPDEYEFEGPYSKKFRQIGNAVPPLLALRIAESVHDKFTEAKNANQSK